MNKQEQLAEQIAKVIVDTLESRQDAGADYKSNIDCIAKYLEQQIAAMGVQQENISDEYEAKEWLKSKAEKWDLAAPAKAVEAMGVQQDIPDSEMYYNQSVMNPYPEDSQSQTAYKKGFYEAWQYLRAKTIAAPAKAVEAMPEKVEKMKCICRTELEQQACCATCDKILKGRQ